MRPSLPAYSDTRCLQTQTRRPSLRPARGGRQNERRRREQSARQRSKRGSIVGQLGAAARGADGCSGGIAANAIQPAGVPEAATHLHRTPRNEAIPHRKDALLLDDGAHDLRVREMRVRLLHNLGELQEMAEQTFKSKRAAGPDEQLFARSFRTAFR